MDMHRVESSNIMAVGYDEGEQALVVEFRGGSRYRYGRVPKAVFEELMAAPSKGSFMHRRIAHDPAYTCERLPDGVRA